MAEQAAAPSAEARATLAHVAGLATRPLTRRAPLQQFYLPNYRMGKTLGIGSFGKVCRLCQRNTCALWRATTAVTRAHSCALR